MSYKDKVEFLNTVVNSIIETDKKIKIIGLCAVCLLSNKNVKRREMEIFEDNIQFNIETLNIR